MNVTLLSAISIPKETNLSVGYIIGGMIALLILGYLVYTLLHPEEF